jgi:hypothetical protein
MLIVDGRITMSESEWLQFQTVTLAPWKPRTPEEFNAMCDLGSAAHRAADTEGMGDVYALAPQKMKFGANGEVNFPADQRRLAYVKVHGHAPTEDQLQAFEDGVTPKRPGLSLVSAPSN